MVKSQLKTSDRPSVVSSRLASVGECAPQSIPQIAEWNNNISAAGERLLKAVDNLLTKIAAVTREEANDKCAAENARPSLVPLADAMRSHCELIHRAAERLEYAANRVEL
jgi:hypothetical protein